MPGFALLAQASEAMPKGPFAIDPGVSLWTLVIFVLLLVVLGRWAWPAILKAVEDRERKIQAQLDEADRVNQEAKRVLVEYQQKLAAAHAEAQELVAAGRQAADKVREDIIAKARAEHEEMVARARREIVAEREKALAELRGEAVELSLAAASKVIERNLDNESDRRLVREYLDSLHATRS